MGPGKTLVPVPCLGISSLPQNQELSTWKVHTRARKGSWTIETFQEHMAQTHLLGHSSEGEEALGTSRAGRGGAVRASFPGKTKSASAKDLREARAGILSPSLSLPPFPSPSLSFLFSLFPSLFFFLLYY